MNEASQGRDMHGLDSQRHGHGNRLCQSYECRLCGVSESPLKTPFAAAELTHKA